MFPVHPAAFLSSVPAPFGWPIYTATAANAKLPPKRVNDTHDRDTEGFRAIEGGDCRDWDGLNHVVVKIRKRFEAFGVDVGDCPKLVPLNAFEMH